MIATVKETLTSLRDPGYGSRIISKSPRSVIWYWTKYLILISLVPLILIIFAITRFLPQLPRLIEDNFPKGVLGSKDHQLFSTIDQPFRYQTPEVQDSGSFTFIFDLEATPSAIESVTDGMLIAKDRLIVKTSDGSIQTQTFERLPDFSVDKYQIADWLDTHRFQIWTWMVVLSFIIGAIVVFLTLVYRLLSFLFWAAVFWLADKYWLKKSVPFSGLFNLVIYASVLPLILSAILFIAPNGFLGLLNIIIMTYFVYIWMRQLPDKSRS